MVVTLPVYGRDQKVRYSDNMQQSGVVLGLSLALSGLLSAAVWAVPAPGGGVMGSSLGDSLLENPDMMPLRDWEDDDDDLWMQRKAADWLEGSFQDGE